MDPIIPDLYLISTPEFSGSFYLHISTWISSITNSDTCILSHSPLGPADSNFSSSHQICCTYSPITQKAVIHLYPCYFWSDIWKRNFFVLKTFMTWWVYFKKYLINNILPYSFLITVNKSWCPKFRASKVSVMSTELPQGQIIFFSFRFRLLMSSLLSMVCSGLISVWAMAPQRSSFVNEKCNKRVVRR